MLEGRRRHLQREENNNKNATSEENISKTSEKTATTKKPSYRILYVDDDLDILFSIKMGLESLWFYS